MEHIYISVMSHRELIYTFPKDYIRLSSEVNQKIKLYDENKYLINILFVFDSVVISL